MEHLDDSDKNLRRNHRNSPKELRKKTGESKDQNSLFIDRIMLNKIMLI